MKYELWYSVVVRDRHGKVVSRERRRSRSFLKQWNQLLFVQMTGVSQTITDIDGVNRTIDEHEDNFNMTGSSTNSGIVCGTGDTPVTVEDYQLAALIAYGTGPGQFVYPGSTVSEVSIADSHALFVVSRTATNNSGGLITVKEVGICTWMRNSTRYYMCGIREVLVAPQAVPDGGAITVDYTLEVVA